MKSMTGYGFGKAETRTCHIEVSVRTINGRFFDPRFHVPRELLAFESELKRILQNHFSRGTMDIFIGRRMKRNGIESKISLHKDLLQQYNATLAQMAKFLKTSYQPQVELLARLPDVLQVEVSNEDFVDEGALFKAMEQACRACVQERKREGSALRSDLEKLLKGLEAQARAIAGIRDQVNTQLRQRLDQRLKARTLAPEIEPQRIGQEVALLLEKSDINEELVRLQEHMKNYKQLLAATGPLGKKLDFYTQELLREVNTIGSKSSVSELTHIVVEAKTIIERMREQVQNVE